MPKFKPYAKTEAPVKAGAKAKPFAKKPKGKKKK